MTPLLDRGSVTFQKVLRLREPRSAAASKRLTSSFTKVAYSGSIIKGRYA